MYAMETQPMMAKIQSTFSNEVYPDWAGFIFPSQFILRSFAELSGRPRDASSCASGKWSVEDWSFAGVVVCRHFLWIGFIFEFIL